MRHHHHTIHTKYLFTMLSLTESNWTDTIKIKCIHFHCLSFIDRPFIQCILRDNSHQMETCFWWCTEVSVARMVRLPSMENGVFIVVLLGKYRHLKRNKLRQCFTMPPLHPLGHRQRAYLRKVKRKLAQSSCFTLGLQQGEDIAFADWTLHVADDLTILLSDKFNFDLGTLSLGTGAAEHLDDASQYNWFVHGLLGEFVDFLMIAKNSRVCQHRLPMRKRTMPTTIHAMHVIGIVDGAVHEFRTARFVYESRHDALYVFARLAVAFGCRHLWAFIGSAAA